MAIDVPLAPNFAQTLQAVAQAMAGAHDPWWIIGSAAVALHGAGPLIVADVDVLLSPVDALRLLPGLGVDPMRGSDHPAFRSEVFGTWRAHPLPVEFMAGFRHRRGADWVPVAPRTREAVHLGSAALHVPSRDELLEIIVSFGRPKDRVRARLLG